jgi:hypothetical protein
LLRLVVERFDFNGCAILESTVTPYFVNSPRPPDMEVRESNKTVPVTCMSCCSQFVVLFRFGRPVEDTAELNVEMPDPDILIFDIEEFVVVGNCKAVEEFE